ncbi:MAG TPA: FAD-binding and (Fe-S)-binding domain-containing protein [Solirubrobacterales bacterium]|nr:FAD-binding and (Fe-S)-binding domain-containing protein [Solirubrobacterales bacterium]
MAGLRALLDRGPAALKPPTGDPAPDRAPDALAAGIAQPLRGELEALLGADRVLARPGDLVKYASDASPYRLFPQAVVMAKEVDDVAKLLAFGRRRGIPVTFRSGGTSLNGQGQTEGILVDVRRHFRGLTVEEDGAALRVGTGTILGHANKVLAPHGRRLGPDPASTDVATVGGVVANNSGGMRCGVTKDSYSTLRSLTFVLPSGTRIDTAAPGAAAAFEAAEPELAAGLAAIRDEIRADAELTARIRRKFEIKNTTGYRLCAFLDADEPLAIFRRLLVGSEGTLAYVPEVVFETVPQPPLTTVAWVHFPDIDRAVEPVGELIASGATAVELMIAPALITAAWNMVGAPQEWKELDPTTAALLVEFGGETEVELDAQVERALAIVAGHETIAAPSFTREAEEVEMAWRVREGLQGLVGQLRLPGTSLILEDVCVAPARIAECARDLQALLTEHGFLPGVAGHASAGNLHFMLTPDFSKPEDLERYESFMEGLVGLIVEKYDGSLKAEHGTGLNMAPYVEREWGTQATELMWRVKRLADPDGVLSPGVVLNRDPGVHLRNLKTEPPIEESATRCVECGFCEPVCPSRDLTTTPRQRIVLRREIARQAPGSPVQAALLEELGYEALDTCAADGSCQLACPVGIDTGKLVKEMRAERHTERAERAALATAKRWGAVESASRTALRVGGGVARRTRKGRALPGPARARLPEATRAGAAAVYVPSCTNRIFGGGPVEALVAVSARAGLPVWIPADVAGSCCGLPWSSKGYGAAHGHKANELVERLWEWSGEGALPIVVDAASCTGSVVEPGEGTLSEENAAHLAAMTILDSVAWAHDRLLPGLEVTRKLDGAAIHPTCATHRQGDAGRLAALAAVIAGDVYLPPTGTCCGFAGDRGIAHPELTAAATRAEAAEVASAVTGGRHFDAYLSSNRTCEIGMTRATGRPYESVINALERATRC